MDGRYSQPVLAPFDPDRAADVAGWVRSLDEARAWSGHQGPDLPMASVFGEWHRDPDVHPYVMWLQSKLIAYGEIWTDHAAREIELARLIVDPEHRQQGLGRRLVEELLLVASRYRFGVAYLRVLPENAAALACYRRAGFARVPAADEQQFNAGQPAEYVWMQRRF